MQVVQPSPLAPARRLLGRGCRLGNEDTAPRRQLPDHLGEALSLELHEEAEYIALFLAAEAIKRPPCGVHVKGRGLFLMKRAQSFVTGSDLLQLNMLADDGNDVGSLAHFVDHLVGYHTSTISTRSKREIPTKNLVKYDSFSTRVNLAYVDRRPSTVDGRRTTVAPKYLPFAGRRDVLVCMRRASDRREGERTGVGRRARDQILSGRTSPSPVLNGRHELSNLVLFLADDQREAALAVGGIESFLFRARSVLEKPALAPEDLRDLVEDRDVVERFDLLADAIGSLRRSMASIHEKLKSNR